MAVEPNDIHSYMRQMNRVLDDQAKTKKHYTDEIGRLITRVKQLEDSVKTLEDRRDITPGTTMDTVIEHFIRLNNKVYELEKENANLKLALDFVCAEMKKRGFAPPPIRPTVDWGKPGVTAVGGW